MKKITILSIDEDACSFYKDQLNKIFKDVIVDYRNLEMMPVPLIQDTDLILYTDPEIINLLIDRIRCDAPQLMMKRTITRAALKEINKIEPDSRVLVVNINEFMANETMALIYQLGKTDIFMEAYFPGKELSFDSYDYIIHVAPEQIDCAKNIPGKSLVIGHRVLDISNVLDIIYILHIEEKTSRDIMVKMLNLVPTFWYGVNYSIEQKIASDAQLDFMVDYLDGGVLMVDSDLDITTINEGMCKILGLEKKDILYKNLKEVFEKKEIEKILRNQNIKEELIKIRGIECFVTVRDVNHKSEFFGKMIIVREYFNVVELFNKTNINHKSGYFSRYTFKDIVGSSFNIVDNIKIAKLYARTEKPVLILGDTGTGKELFAGSIHNYSKRAKKPFVAINCSTLSPTLLESELFGYEGGAFTGAKKSGKIGLFEKANGGTLFLDEIGDLPIELQPRLLRVLADGMILRVGGEKLINVDVKIITATNRNIYQMVEKGIFRRDLLYRLNAFEVNIAALKDRGDDIFRIIDFYFKKNNVSRILTKEFKDFCKNYNWPGNVRELINVLDYIEVMTDSEVGFYSLPPNLRSRDFISIECESLIVLNFMYSLQLLKKSPGRRTIVKLFTNIYYKISENEIRNILDKLRGKELIEVKIGRNGSRLTLKGKKYLFKNFGFLDENSEFIKRVDDILRSIG